MVSTRKKRQSDRNFLSQLDDFDQDIIIGNTSSERQENIMVNEGTNDRDCTVGTSSDISVTNENTVNVKPWKDVLMKGLTGKWAILFIRLKTESRTQFWPNR